MFNDRLSSRTLLAAVLVIGLAAGLAAAADPVVDDGTLTNDNTTSESEITDDHTFENFTANESRSSTVQYRTDSNNTKVEILVPVDGQNETVYTNTSAELLEWDSSNNEGQFNVSINHGDLADVPGAINENRTGYLTITNNTEVADPNTTTLTVYFNHTDERSVMYVGDGTVANNSDVGVEHKETLFSVGSVNVTDPRSNDRTHLTTTRNVNGSATDVVVILGNDSVAQDYEDTFGSADAGTWKGTAVHTVEGEGARAYASELPDDVADDASTVTYTQVGGQDALVIETGSAAEDTDSIDVESYSSVSSYAFQTKMDAYGTAAAVGVGGGGVLLIGYLFVFGRPEDEELEIEE
jgi:hypothetical protein